MLQVYDFLGRGGGWFYRASAALFRAFRKSRFPKCAQKGETGKTGGLARGGSLKKQRETPLSVEYK